MDAAGTCVMSSSGDTADLSIKVPRSTGSRQVSMMEATSGDTGCHPPHPFTIFAIHEDVGSKAQPKANDA